MNMNGLKWGKILSPFTSSHSLCNCFQVIFIRHIFTFIYYLSSWVQNSHTIPYNISRCCVLLRAALSARLCVFECDVFIQVKMFLRSWLLNAVVHQAEWQAGGVFKDLFSHSTHECPFRTVYGPCQEFCPFNSDYTLNFFLWLSAFQ